MSNWTHVAAVFRVDSIMDDTLDVDKVFGKECVMRSSSDEDFKSFCDEWPRMVGNKSEYLPYGSEGSLNINVWTNPDSSMVARHVVTVWGGGISGTRTMTRSKRSVNGFGTAAVKYGCGRPCAP